MSDLWCTDELALFCVIQPLPSCLEAKVVNFGPTTLQRVLLVPSRQVIVMLCMAFNGPMLN